MTTKIQITDFQDYRDFLQAKLAKMKAQNRKFSFQYCSQKLGTTASYLKLVVSKKRHISLDRISKISALFKLNEFDRQYFTFLFLQNTTQDAELTQYFDGILSTLKHRKLVSGEAQEYKGPQQPAAREQSHIFTSYLSQVLVEMARVAGFRADAAWIHSQICGEHLTMHEIESTLQTLFEKGLLEKCEDGSVKTPGFACGGPGIGDLDQFKSFKIGASQVMRVLDRVADFRPNMFYMMTLALSRDEWAAVKSEFVKLRDYMIETSRNSKNPDTIYFVSNNIFGATR